MRSKFKGYYTNLRSVIGNKIFSKSIVISNNFLNKRVLIYNGNKFISLLVKENMLGYKFGEFLVTKKLGSKIHLKKK